MEELSKQIQIQANKMYKTGKLFRVDIPGQVIWDLYLASFVDGNDPVFRDPQSSSHNCNHCNNFLRRYGNVAALKNGEIISLFSSLDLSAIDYEYHESIRAMDTLITTSVIKDVFFETYGELNSLPYEACNKVQVSYLLGIPKNIKRYTKEEAALYGVVKPNELRTFNHFHLQLPKQFVDSSGKSIEALMDEYRDKYSVFKRAVEEIPMDTLVLVKDLINQGSLLDGTSHLNSVEEMIQAKKLYDAVNDDSKDNFCWDYTYSLSERVAKFRSTLVGVLCTELAERKELNAACLSWNKRVDPANYHKASAPLTQRQIAEAQKFVEEEGYEESFNRRLATFEDIDASEIKHVNEGDGSIKKVSLFDNVKSTSTRHERSEFEGVEEISIEKFMKDILPGCTSVEAFLKNSHEGNLCTLTTAVNKDSKPIFKWDNNYDTTFYGNLAGKSQIKEAVKSHGGVVDGVLRFSIMWAENDGDNSDLDAHCMEPHEGFHIYHNDKRSPDTGGNLDVDITQPKEYVGKGKKVVENITYPTLSKMPDGVYKLFVRQYAARSSKGFKAEIEFNGEIYYYEYNTPVRGDIQVAEVTLKNGEFSIEHKLPETSSSKELWGLETNSFHKVKVACLSPNHWGENKVGNLHYMFMLDGCQADTSIRGFHNEGLLPELLKHRKVMEVLGNTAMIEPTGKHLAGIGFNSTVRDELIVKVQGSFKRMLKIKF